MTAGHVVLVGLMGSGKTTVGRRLATCLGRPFVDADEELAARAGASVAEVFEQRGEAGFRSLEREVLDTLLAAAEPTVIAAGGGVVVAGENRDRLRAAGTVVWLDGTPAFLASRAQAKPHRPLLAGADPRQLFGRLHAERAGWYAEVADLRVSIEPFHANEDKPKQALAEHIAELVIAHEGVPA